MVCVHVVIYGAGAAGVQLAASLRYGDHHILQAFADDELRFGDAGFRGRCHSTPLSSDGSA